MPVIAPSKPNVRPATEADVESQVELQRHLAERHETVIDKAELRRGILTLRHNPSLGECLAVEVDGEVVGQVKLKPIFETWFDAVYLYVDNLVVCPALQAKGIGSLLLAQAKARARAAGVCYMRSFLSAHNHSAMQTQACHLKAGFRPIGEMYECEL